MKKIEEAMKLIGPGCVCEVNLGNILVLTGALKEAIEQHEAFRQEVSDAVVDYVGYVPLDSQAHHITRFIITKPDPLLEAWAEAHQVHEGISKLETFRAALAKRGLEIREKGE